LMDDTLNSIDFQYVVGGFVKLIKIFEMQSMIVDGNQWRYI
jgi:hypothetical protein